MAENLCHNAGCPDLCCKRGTWFVGVNFRERQRVFPKAVKVDSDVDERDMYDEIYAVGECLIFLGRQCPHLNYEGCDGNRLNACEAYEFGGVRCNKLRVKMGLEQINSAGEQIPRKKGLLAFFGVK